MNVRIHWPAPEDVAKIWDVDRLPTKVLNDACMAVVLLFHVHDCSMWYGRELYCYAGLVRMRVVGGVREIMGGFRVGGKSLAVLWHVCFLVCRNK